MYYNNRPVDKVYQQGGKCVKFD